MMMSTKKITKRYHKNARQSGIYLKVRVGNKDLFCVKMAGPKALAAILTYSNQLSLEIFD